MIDKILDLVYEYLQGECGDGDCVIYVRAFDFLFDEIVEKAKEKFPDMYVEMIDKYYSTNHFTDRSNENFYITNNKDFYEQLPDFVHLRICI